MRIYLAAHYSRRVELVGYAAELRTMGHTVTSRWLNGSHKISSASSTLGGSEAARLRRVFALEDVQDVTTASVIISFTEPSRSTLGIRGGRHVEFGFAVGFNQATRLFGLGYVPYRLIVVGHRDNLFHWLPEIEFYDTWTEAKRVLASSKEREQ